EVTRAKCLTNVGLVLGKIGRLEEAVEVHGRSVALYASLVKRFSASASYRLSLARNQINLGAAWDDLSRQRHQRQRPEAEKAYRQALPILEKLAEQFKTNPRCQELLALAHANLSAVLEVAGNAPEAEEQLGEALGGYQKLVDAYPMIPDYLHQLARSQRGLALLLKKG